MPVSIDIACRTLAYYDVANLAQKIKVLGFYDKEVYSYVTRETVILTAIGIVLGLIGGYFLNYFIIRNL